MTAAPLIATYRLQMGAGFGFADAAAVAPRLRRLGVSHLYLSPVLQAVSTSTHGYDVARPDRLDPRLGSRARFDQLADRARSAGLGLVLDIVPNHMAASQENPWWRDVLRRGSASRYARVFDIDWAQAPPLGKSRGRLTLPVLGAPYGREIRSGALRPAAVPGGFAIVYHDRELPLSIGSWPALLRYCLERSRGVGDLRERAEALLPPLIETLDTAKGRARMRELGFLHERPEVRSLLAEILARRGRSTPALRGLLDDLLRRQHYRLAHWRLAPVLINYRRFFDINELVGVRVEDPRVFDLTHALLLRLHREGRIAGLRIDHVDGLRDPEGYLAKLAEALVRGAGDTPVWVEKILTGGETLPASWPTAGTTGYEFTRAVAGLFVDPEGVAEMNRFYADITGDPLSLRERLYLQKGRVIHDAFQAEFNRLARRLAVLGAGDLRACDILPVALRRALVEVSASLDVYRTYVREGGVTAEDQRRILRAVRDGRRRAPGVPPEAFELLEDVFTLRPGPGDPPEKLDAWLDFTMRWQQVTGSITAKALEDTVLYQHTALLSLNEVGGDPEPEPGDLGPEAFHRFNATRLRRRPRAMNGTATHDSKRGEDLRARLHVLAEDPEGWAKTARRWHALNRRWRESAGGTESPDAREELLVYQTLLGAWPMDAAAAPGRGFSRRMTEYVIKAAREANLRTGWIEPVGSHEAALKRFVSALLDPQRSGKFLREIQAMVGRIAPAGAVNSLAQVLLKSAAPGVPDFYQGTELWSLTLVDPDNRRPVDFDALGRALDSVVRLEERVGAEAAGRELLSSWRDGRVKLWVTLKALALRRAHPELFAEGSYLPMKTRGTRSAHLCAFARKLRGRWVACIVPLRVRALLRNGVPAFRSDAWEGTSVRLPAKAPRRWRDALSGREIRADARGRLSAAALLGGFPVSLIEGQ